MKTYSMNQLERYPIYLKYFKELRDQGIEIVSSPKIAAKLGYSEEQVRKDLQNVSLEPGRPKKGRSVAQLIEDLETFLGYRERTVAVVMGVGHLGSALLNFPAFSEMGLSLQAGFDNDPAKIGTNVGGKPVYSMDRLSEVMREIGATVAILTVPSPVAEEAASRAIEGGAKAIWNFAPAHLDVPEGVVVENVNLASSLAVLTHRMSLTKAKGDR